MKVYVVYACNDENYNAGWTGNYAYATSHLIGVFDSKEKAEAVINDEEIREEMNMIEVELNTINVIPKYVECKLYNYNNNKCYYGECSECEYNINAYQADDKFRMSCVALSDNTYDY